MFESDFEPRLPAVPNFFDVVQRSHCGDHSLRVATPGK